MLKSVNHISSLDIDATDGTIGKVYSLLFDDRTWDVRYLVVDTHTWLPGKKVLLVPSVVCEPRDRRFRLPVTISKEQVKNSPALDTHKPVSREREMELHQHYGWVPYWTTDLSLVTPSPAVQAAAGAPAPASTTTEQEKSHLRSTREVLSYRIHAVDGRIGHVEDFVLDDDEWIIRYLVIDTRTWLPGGKKVLVSPHWASAIRWDEAAVVLDLTKDQIKDSPEYDPRQAVNRELEIQLYDYYGRPTYWR